jgi:hypothetical protein
MEGSAAHFELQGNLLARQPKSPQPTDGVLSVTLNNGPCLQAGENVDGTIVLHPVVANQVKVSRSQLVMRCLITTQRVSLTIRGSSPLADNPKTSLFWIENYTVCASASSGGSMLTPYQIYVSNRKSRQLLDGQPLVLDFSEALPSSSSSKRVRDPMTW